MVSETKEHIKLLIFEAPFYTLGYGSAATARK
jgi:hypothetical protein